MFDQRERLLTCLRVSSLRFQIVGADRAIYTDFYARSAIYRFCSYMRNFTVGGVTYDETDRDSHDKCAQNGC